MYIYTAHRPRGRKLAFIASTAFLIQDSQPTPIIKYTQLQFLLFVPHFPKGKKKKKIAFQSTQDKLQVESSNTQGGTLSCSL